LRLENELINGLLLSRKGPPDRKGPRDVARVIAVLAASVDEEQVAGFDAPVVLPIVKDARVGS
jgi:hypothetical protein